MTQASTQVALFVEGIGTSAALGDLRILVELDPDGVGNADYISHDAVRVTVIDDITVQFAGRFQDRLATDGDPTLHPRGAIGSTRALEGEPDFDRVIRFSGPVALRSHANFVPVKVTAIMAGSLGGQAFSFGDEIIGKSVNLGPNSWFNGLVNGPGLEPIDDFQFKTGGNLLFAESTVAPQGQGIGSMTAAVLAARGINPVGDLAARKAALEADFAALTPAQQTGTMQGRNLRTRLDLIEQFEGDLYPLQLGFTVDYPGILDKNISIAPGDSAVLALLRAASSFDLAMEFYNWDSDTLTGAVEGTIKKRP